MFEIFSIQTINDPNNAYFINRNEYWSIKKMNVTFSSIEQAKQFIINQSCSFRTELPNLLIGLTNEEKEKMIQRFCFDDDVFLTRRRFFIGYPPTEKIINQLKKENINVET